MNLRPAGGVRPAGRFCFNPSLFAGVPDGASDVVDRFYDRGEFSGFLERRRRSSRARQGPIAVSDEDVPQHSSSAIVAILSWLASSSVLNSFITSMSPCCFGAAARLTRSSCRLICPLCLVTAASSLVESRCAGALRWRRTTSFGGRRRQPSRHRRRCR